MPDPTKQTISATQAPALFDASPYVTRWMLYKAFADGMAIDAPSDARMSWGTKLEPLIIEQAASDLALEIVPNQGQYFRSGQLGATRDATIITPDRGPGAFETKCIFDYRTWMQDWGGGAKVPRHYEIQLQVQMLVGDGAESFTHGRFGAWVAGELHYFERDPIPQLWDELVLAASMFFRDLKFKHEPDPFGAKVEAPFLASLFDVVPGKVVSFVERPDAVALAQSVRDYSWAKKQERSGAKQAEAIRTRLLALVKDAETAEFFGGIKVKRKQSTIAEHTRKASVRTSLDVFVPDNLPDALLDRPSLRADLEASLEDDPDEQ